MMTLTEDEATTMDKQRTALIAAYEQARDEAHAALVSIAEELQEGGSNHVASCASEWERRVGKLLFDVGMAAEAIRRLDFFDRPRP
jgi:hypothetical protein